MTRNFLTYLLTVCFVSSTLAQEDLLGKWGKKLTKKITDKGSDQVASLDSVDFQFAISLNQNAGFFDVEQKGETTSTLLYGLKSEEDKTELELARDNLETPPYAIPS